MRRITVLLAILGLSLGIFLYRVDSVAIVEPFVGTKVGNVLLEVKNKARSTNEAIQNKVEETISTFVVQIEQAPETNTNTSIKTTSTEVPIPPEKTTTLKQTSHTTTQSAALTANGTIAQTNQYRRKEGLPKLSANALLTLSAQKKVDDMFARQYFEHESPTGIGSDDLARSVGYVYIMIGENLALGDYESDFELVEGWMNSPGHRENILNSKYTEIGVAMKEGMFEGGQVWLAVQEFGRPVSDCPEISASLNTQIEESQGLLEELQQKLTDMLAHIDATHPAYGSVYTQKVDAYNTLVHQYNTFVEQSKKDVATYNAQVRAHNACVQE
jgi:uncharacterized protein YkwD